MINGFWKFFFFMLFAALVLMLLAGYLVARVSG